MIDLDILRVCSLESTPRGTSGAAARIRQRLSSAQKTQIKPPSKLPKGYYDSGWLESLPQPKKKAVKTIKPLIRKVNASV
jgi:hypothetical protein